jgi:hypothetical protein
MKVKPFSNVFIGSLLLGSLLVGAGCSRTKDRAINRTFHQMTAKFNPLFNGQEAYSEALKSLEEEHVDVYDRVLDIYPYNNAKEGSAAAGRLKTAVEKATKTVQEHSMMVRGNQRNLVVYDAYRLLGDAQALLGLDVAAQESYAIITRNTDRKAKRPRNQERLFTKGEAHQFYTAELHRIQILARQKNGPATLAALDELERTGVDERYLEDIRILRAQGHLSNGELLLAADYLRTAAEKGKNKKSNARHAFIAGQLYENMGERVLARAAFERCIAGQPGTYDMLLEAQLHKTINGDGRPQKLYAELLKLLKEPKNAGYRDRIYYALARVAKSQEDDKNQLFYLSRCVGAGQSARAVLWALAYSDRGDMYFEAKRYALAQVDLDSAYALLPEEHALKKTLAKRRDGLNALMAVIGIVERNDSLLVLGTKPDAVLRSKFTAYVKDLKRQEQQAIRAAERAILNAQLNAQSSLMAATGPVAGANTAGGWIFYNPVARAAGIASYTTQWGQRPNVDNWRLQSASGTWAMGNMAQSGPSASEDPTGGEEAYVDPTYDVESYLRAIPKRAEARDSCQQLICSALLEAAAIYRDQIGDLDRALAALMRTKAECGLPDSLSARCAETGGPEGCNDDAFVRYALHRLHLQREEGIQAEAEKIEVLTHYPLSRYAALLRGETLETNTKAPTTKAFRALVSDVENRKWADALKRFDATTWNPEEAPRASLLRAQATGGTEGRSAFIAALTEVEEGFPNTPQAVAAANIKMALASDATDVAASKSPYVEALAAPHQVLIVFSSAGNANDVRNALARFHQQYFAGSPMSIRMLPLTESAQIVAIDGFKNSTEAMDYRTKVKRASAVTQFLNSYDPSYWPITVQNFSHFYSSKDLDGYKRFVEMIYTL